MKQLIFGEHKIFCARAAESDVYYIKRNDLAIFITTKVLNFHLLIIPSFVQLSCSFYILCLVNSFFFLCMDGLSLLALYVLLAARR